MACRALSPLQALEWQPQAVLFFAPADPAAVTPESIGMAEAVLQDRLEPLLAREVRVHREAGGLRVGLADPEHAAVATQLATEIGAVSFFDSLGPIDPGEPVPKGVKIILSDADIASAKVNVDGMGQWTVPFILTPEGTRKMAEYSQVNIGQYLVIARDNVVLCSPLIQEAINKGGRGD